LEACVGGGPQARLPLIFVKKRKAIVERKRKDKGQEEIKTGNRGKEGKERKDRIE